MTTLIDQARAVEARLRNIIPEISIGQCADDGANSIVALIDLHEINVNTLEAMRIELEAAQKDAERYRWLRDEAFNSFIVENMTVYPRHGLDAEIDAAIKAQGDAE